MRSMALCIGGLSCFFLAGCSASVSDGGGGASVAGGAGQAGSVASAGGGALSGSAGATGGNTNGGGGSSAASGGGGAAGSAGSSKGGSAGSGYIPPTCDAAGTGELPSGAPTLTQGEWKDIGPIPNYYGNGIVLDACNPAIMYSAGGNYPASGGPGDTHGVFRTTDAGSTWEQLVNLDSPARVRVDPKDSLHLYVVDGVNGGTQGFWESLDGGETWETPEAFYTAASELTCCDVYNAEPDPSDFNHVLVTFHNGDGILESFDGGDTFIAHQPDPGWANSGGYDAFFLYEPSEGIGDSQTWLYGTQGKGYWRTTDSGGTWTKVTEVSMEHGGGQLYYSTKNDVWYLSGAGSILKSSDNGQSWTSIGPYNGYLSVLGDGTNLYTGGHGGGKFITAKEDDDTNWTDYNQQSFKEGPYGMAFDAQHSIMYSGNASGGLWALKVE